MLLHRVGIVVETLVGYLLLLTPPVLGQSLVFERTHADLGRVTSAGTIEHVFRFRVDGAAAQIDEIRPSCGCLRPKIDKTAYQPGERGAIVLAVHAASQRSGPKRFQLSVRVRDPNPRTLTLTLDVELFSDLIIEPSNLLLYVNGRAAVEQTIRIVDRRPTPLHVTQVVTSSERIVARSAPLRQVAATEGQVAMIELAVAGDYPVGRFDETIEVATSDPKYPTLLIPVTVVRRGRLAMLPERLRVPADQLRDRPVLRQLVLRDQEGKPIRIADVSASEPGIQCTWPDSAERFPRIRVTIDPAHLKPPVDAELRLHIVEPIETTLTTLMTIE